MSKSVVDTLNDFGVEEMIDFLKTNGLGEFEALAVRKHLDGYTFLNLSQAEIYNWIPLISPYQATKFFNFLQQVKDTPESVIFAPPARLDVSPKMSPIRQNFNKPSQNNPFLDSLRAVIQNRADSRKEKTNKSQGLTQNANSELHPPMELSNKKSPLVQPEFHCLVTDTSTGENIYDVPRCDFNRNNPSPEVPWAFAANSANNNTLRKLPSTPIGLKEIDYGSVGLKLASRQSCKLGEYHDKHRNIEMMRSQSLSNISQTNVACPFRASFKNISPTKMERICKTLPRPPKVFPQIDGFDLPDNSPKSPPLEPQDCQRLPKWRDLLSEEFEDGTYLIRPSKIYYSALSVRQGNRVYHLGIKKTEDGMLEVESDGLGLKFASLDGLTAFFKMRPISVRNKRCEVVDIYLNHALPFHMT
ncbi:hypothetical protein Trydic_g6426 [Trypoxylus dichotomus]